jgi:NAD(P) transhydrogenase
VLQLESGKRIVADMALFSVGRIGATDALALPNAGLTVDDRGRIAVDSQFRTSVPHIFAAGDVIGYPSLAATSSEQGRLAACHALGVSASPMADHFPVGIYSVPEISMVGATEQTLTKDKVPYEVGLARYREIARGQILGDDSGLLKMLFHRGDRRLLGVHIIGTGATELLHIGQAVFALGGGWTTSSPPYSTIRRWPSVTRSRRSTLRTSWRCDHGATASAVNGSSFCRSSDGSGSALERASSL